LYKIKYTKAIVSVNYWHWQDSIYHKLVGGIYRIYIDNREIRYIDNILKIQREIEGIFSPSDPRRKTWQRRDEHDNKVHLSRS